MALCFAAGAESPRAENAKVGQVDRVAPTPCWTSRGRRHQGVEDVGSACPGMPTSCSPEGEAAFWEPECPIFAIMGHSDSLRLNDCRDASYARSQAQAP